ncbi:MAG: 2-amino-4-hydroxy-6-hydroxymethyldihydropteridine diphosphokinase [Planctomycetes bacterium]|nr:2-amino-4-hydroxy-6-hydroxymethyldihydropteridine diphosphokinase [Planctomycetota bacterium]
MKGSETAVRAYIAVGSNIDPEESIFGAQVLLQRRVRLTGVSSFYRTPALDRPDQPPFLNGVWEVLTELPPRRLRDEVLRPIETALGRVRTEDRYAPRSIDLDLLLYGDRVVEEADLKIPHPDLARPFVYAPLLELLHLVADSDERDALRALAGVASGRPAEEAEGPACGEPQVEFTRILRESIKP